jgi:hypothetical protein
VRSDFCALLGLLADLRKAHLFEEEIFGKFMVFFLKEGLQLGLHAIFLMICKYFSAKLLD